MKNLTTTERDIVTVIMNCLLFNTCISSKKHKECNGVTLTNIDDGYVCHLTISAESQFFDALNNALEYKVILDYYKAVENLGYSDCISRPPEKPSGSSIFLTEYCDNLCWLSNSIIGVSVSGIYINFNRIKNLLMTLSTCSTYGYTLNTEKLVDKLYTDIRKGVYDLDEDEYI